MTSETDLLKALQRFEKSITVDAIGIRPNFIMEVIAQNIKIGYYLNSIATSLSWSGVPKVTVNVQYENTDVSTDDIYIVSEGEEVHSILCQYIGNYKNRLVLFAKPSVNIDFEYKKFTVVDAPFYSNFIGARIRKGKSSVTPFPFYDFSFDYRIGKVKLSMMENQINNEISRIAKQLFLPSMNAETKAFLAHNYLAYTVKYTLNEKASDLESSYLQSAYGALINKKCVCQGYAEAFKRMMDYADIPCDIVCGRINGSTTYHAWNILKLNNERENYHIDVTWDSVGDRVAYNYFGLKDCDLAGDRTWNREFNVRCSSDKNLLVKARVGIMQFKSQLIKNGADLKILGY